MSAPSGRPRLRTLTWTLAAVALAAALVLVVPGWSSRPGNRTAAPDWLSAEAPSASNAPVSDPDAAFAIALTHPGEGSRVVLVTPDSGSQVVLFADAAASRIQGLTWSPSGRYLGFDLGRIQPGEGLPPGSLGPEAPPALDWEVHVLDTQAGTDRTVRRDLAKPSVPVWSADESLTYSVRPRDLEDWQATFERVSADGQQLDHVSLAPGRFAYTLEPAPGADHGIVRSIDANRIDSQRLVLYEQPSGEGRTIYDGEFWRMHWSPDGRLLAFGGYQDDGNPRITLLDPFEGVTADLTVPGAMGDCYRTCSAPGPVTWSGDGRRLLVDASDDGNSFLVSLPLGGGQVDVYTAHKLWKWLEAASGARDTELDRDPRRAAFGDLRCRPAPGRARPWSDRHSTRRG